GPGEFPVDQIMTARWFAVEGQKNQCPVADVVFPQLSGHSVKVYPCNATRNCKRTFIKMDEDRGTGLADLHDHLRIMHDYSGQDFHYYVQENNISFDEVYGGEHAVKEATFDGATQAPAPEPDCADCDWTIKANTKRPDSALKMHRTQKHPPLKVSVATK
ncbi:hypothetical protein LCGC14_2764420, partial [marine sediment metagenome]